MTSDIKSRRTILQSVVASALLSAAPFTALEAATKGGRMPAVVELADGSKLRIKKAGKDHYLAVHEHDSTKDKNATGSFTSKTGAVFVLEGGQVKSVQPAPGETPRGDNFGFTAFVQS